MHRCPARRLACAVLCLGLILTAAEARACSVPVFRYALERWPADPYLVVVFHGGELTTEQKALINRLGPEGEPAENFANIKVRAVNVETETDENMLELWRLQQTDPTPPTLPWIAIHYPAPLPPAWKGPFTKEVVDGLIDSPVRREVARRILKGQTAVWVFLEGNDPQKNDAAWELLQRQLSKQQETLQLPEIDPQDVADGLVSADAQLRIDFSALRLSRDDPQETMFVEMLLGSEGDGDLSLRKEDPDKPMAIPIFGRGRALYALVGEGINENTITEACKFLTGPCSCQVKGENPGVDVVMAVDWESLVDSHLDIDKALPPLAGLGAFAANSTDDAKLISASAETETSVADAENPAPDGDDNLEPHQLNPVLRNTLLLTVIVAFCVAGASFFLMRKS